MRSIDFRDNFEICEPYTGWLCESVVQSGKRLEHSMPMPTKSLLARLFSGRLVLKEVPANTAANIVSMDGRVLVEIRLADDEVVATKISRLVGLVGATFDGGRISPSLTAFTLGHTIMHTVRGPGNIYFESKSRSVKLLQGDCMNEQSFDPRAIVCFGAGSEFVVTSGRKLLSLFAGGWQMELKSGWVVIDGSTVADGGLGLSSLLKRVYLPWG